MLKFIKSKYSVVVERLRILFCIGEVSGMIRSPKVGHSD
jgi:hypothetical protein